MQEVHTTSVPRPSVLYKIFLFFGAIDIANYYRQGSLGFERNWETKTWWHRVWATITGMLVVNVFFGYIHEYLQAHHYLDTNIKDLDAVADELACMMIFNPMVPEPPIPHHAQVLAVCIVCDPLCYCNKCVCAIVVV